MRIDNADVVFGGTRPLLGLIEAVYASVQDPTSWDKVLEGISEVLGGASIFMAGGTSHAPILAKMRLDPDAVSDYLNYYASVNVMSQRCDRSFTDGSVRYGNHVISDNELEKTEIYNDFFRRYNIHYSCGINVPLAGESVVYLSCLRPREARAFSEREGVVLETLFPHIQRALGLYATLSQRQANQKGLETSLDAFGHAVFGLNGAGKVVFQNAKAETLLRAADGLRLHEGKLDAAGAGQSAVLRQLIADAVATGCSKGTYAGGSVLLRRRGEAGSLRVTVSPFLASSEFGTPRLAALVFVGGENDTAGRRSSALRMLYGITPSEERVADLLLAGLPVREIAERLGITQETSRFHVKRLLAKTGTAKQAELIRLMLSIPASLQS